MQDRATVYVKLEQAASSRGPQLLTWSIRCLLNPILPKMTLCKFPSGKFMSRTF